MLRDIVDDKFTEFAEDPDTGVVGAEVEDMQGIEVFEAGEVLHEEVLSSFMNQYLMCMKVD